MSESQSGWRGRMRRRVVVAAAADENRGERICLAGDL